MLREPQWAQEELTLGSVLSTIVAAAEKTLVEEAQQGEDSQLDGVQPDPVRKKYKSSAGKRVAAQAKKRGRRPLGWDKKQSRAKWATAKGIAAQFEPHCTSAHDATLMLGMVTRELAQKFPGLKSSRSKPVKQCHCERLLPALGQLRGSVQGAALASLDKMLADCFITRAGALGAGVKIGKEAWSRALSGAPLGRPGRPSKVANPATVNLVSEVVLAKTQDSSTWIVVRDPSDGGKGACQAKVLTDTLLQIYLSDSRIAEGMSITTFLKVVKRWLPQVREGQKRTDYCDHCHLYDNSILKRCDKSVVNGSKHTPVPCRLALPGSLGSTRLLPFSISVSGRVQCKPSLLKASIVPSRQPA